MSIIIPNGWQRSAVIVRSMYRISGRRRRRNDTIAMAYVRALVSSVGQHCLPAMSLATSVSRGTKACWHAGTRSRLARVCATDRRPSDILPRQMTKRFLTVYTEAAATAAKWGPAGCHMDGVFKIGPHRYGESWQIVSRRCRNDLRAAKLVACHERPPRWHIHYKCDPEDSSALA